MSTEDDAKIIETRRVESGIAAAEALAATTHTDEILRAIGEGELHIGCDVNGEKGLVGVFLGTRTFKGYERDQKVDLCAMAIRRAFDIIGPAFGPLVSAELVKMRRERLADAERAADELARAVSSAAENLSEGK